MRNKVLGLSSLLGILILIFDSKTALAGAQTGASLCIQVVIPSLFPFFFLSSLLTGSMMGMRVAFLRPIGRMLGIPVGAESLLIPAFLGGYPSGAHAISQASQSGCISKQQAEQMLVFCNNAGPSFIFGIISQSFSQWYVPWLLWCVHITSAILSSFFFHKNPAPHRHFTGKHTGFSEALRSAVSTMASVCGWVILFRVLLSILDRWFLWVLPPAYYPVAAGILEITNGCTMLMKIHDLKLRVVICSILVSFGGICVAMQTWSVTQGISKRKYLLGKLLQCIFSTAISIAILYSHLWIFPVIGISLWLITNKENLLAFPAHCVYNSRIDGMEES